MLTAGAATRTLPGMSTPGKRKGSDAFPARLAAWDDHTVAGLRRFRRMAQRELKSKAPGVTVDIAHRIERMGTVGSHLVACELLDDPRIRPTLTPEDVSAMGARLDSWVSVDTFAVYVLGPVWREGRVTDDFVHDWARDADRWRRRAALAATVALNCKARGGTGDVSRTLGVCSLLVDDRDDMVVKAMSWALRELARRDAAPVEAFLRSHGGRVAARVRREVTRKITTGTKSGHSARGRTARASRASS